MNTSSSSSLCHGNLDGVQRFRAIFSSSEDDSFWSLACKASMPSVYVGRSSLPQRQGQWMSPFQDLSFSHYTTSAKPNLIRGQKIDLWCLNNLPVDRFRDIFELYFFGLSSAQIDDEIVNILRKILSGVF